MCDKNTTIEELAEGLDDKLGEEKYQFEIDLPDEGHLQVTRTVRRRGRR